MNGSVSRLGCRSFKAAKPGEFFINCWIYTNQNLIYVFKVDAFQSQTGELDLRNIYRNFYNTGKEQYITGCSISDEFLVCTSEDLSKVDPKERTSVLVYRIYNTTTRKDYFEYARLDSADLQNVTPMISTIQFLPKSARLLQGLSDRFLSDSDHFRLLQAKGREYDQQSVALFSAYNEGVKRHRFKVSPAAITMLEKDVAKLNPEEFKKVEVIVTGATSAQISKFKLSDLKKDTVPDPVKPDDKTDPKDNSNSDSNTSKGIGFFGWFMILLLIGGVIFAAWYLVRREQLKSKAREKMIEDTPEMEIYA